MSGRLVDARHSPPRETAERAWLGGNVERALAGIRYQSLGDRESRDVRRLRALEAVGEREHVVGGGDLLARDHDSRGADRGPRFRGLLDGASKRAGECATVSRSLQLGGTRSEFRPAVRVGSVRQRAVKRIVTRADAEAEDGGGQHAPLAGAARREGASVTVGGTAKS
jgi:hypothetical protein